MVAREDKIVDKVFGEVTTPNVENQDFVLMREGGVPLYNFGAVVDDVTMGITLVACGRDHMINTPPQILLYRALGAPVRIVLPVGADRKCMIKVGMRLARQGVRVMEFVEPNEAR